MPELTTKTIAGYIRQLKKPFQNIKETLSLFENQTNVSTL